MCGGDAAAAAAATAASAVGARLVKTQCSCSSGFSSILRPWIGSSLNYDCLLVTRGSVRSRTQSLKKITAWTRSSAVIGAEGTLRVFLLQARFTKIDVHRSGIRPTPTVTDEMHTTHHMDKTSTMRIVGMLSERSVAHFLALCALVHEPSTPEHAHCPENR